ncbi:site-specific integrase [Pontibacter akesuensis]|uniref:Site-specific recombinase XerD n=1 Tax=Pontibacter akesuensis TaxID=388950 RepID=A0A1I7JN78_9BACT|nr:site-specific integrase [Pontibacter akesuensis]GHA68746.1 tyrosine recombinase [Pontibacter akesuensis]SFU86609.1 Site-specific recombinase XerD [Pontibacter akesuensis]
MKKQTNKEPVRLRQRKLSNGNLSLYLDYYNGGVRQYEYLKLYLIEKPKNALDKQSNQSALELAQRIKAKRTEEALLGNYDLQSKSLSHTDFLKFYQAYITTYTKADYRVLSASLKKFKAYLKERFGKEKLLCKELTQNLIIGYKDYLEANHTGEGPLTYFNRFRKVVKHGIRENLFPKNPLPEKLKFKSGGMSKGVLSLDEVSKLASTECGNETIKRAFLFACNTGLRFGDIKVLQWQDISNDELLIKQNKTQEVNRLRLNRNALTLIGEKGKPKDLIFPLPSFEGSVKTVKNWVKRAGIEKRITWHSARHSFATNILLLGYDIKTLSQLLGHTSIKHTQKYLTIADERKAQAVNALPDLNF